MREQEFATDPLAQFERWFEDARREGLELPEAMTLATAAADGTPSARMVLLKGVDERGFLFFTNYESRKALEQAYAELENAHPGEEVPRPPWWGGYVLRPETVEFWQNGPDRLHDRLRYRREGEGWVLERLSPERIRSGTTREVEDMAGELKGKRIAVLATNGVEDSELREPHKAVTDAGADADVVSLEEGEIEGKKGTKFKVDKLVTEVDASDYDGLVLPGGVANPDKLRTDEKAVRFVREFFEQGKPVGVICHGGWTLVEADVVRGRKLTSYPSIKTDLVNAGADWVDEEVVVDRGLVSSRWPNDLPAFNAKLIEEFAEGIHEEQAEATREAVRA